MPTTAFRLALLLLAGALVAGAQTPPPTRPLAPRGRGGPAGAESRPARLVLNYEKPDPLPLGGFPAVDLKNSNTATFVGFQFGPAKREVLYCCFDQSDVTENADRCWYYIPGSNAPVAKPLRSKALPVKPVRGGGLAMAAPRVFEFPVLKSQFGPVTVLQKLTVTYGLQSKGLLHISAETQLTDPEGSSQCRLDALLGEQSRSLPEQKIVPLLGAAELKFYFPTGQAEPTVRPWIKVGSDFILQPLRGMDDTIEVVVRQPPELAPAPEPGKRPRPAAPAGSDVVKKAKVMVKLRERSQAGGHGEGDGELLPLTRLKEGQRYLVETHIDLGPFGTLGATNQLTVPGKVKL